MTNERTHIDLFTGLGGFSLAAKANGVRTIAMCEADPRCQEFLAKAWPGVPVWPDVRTFGMGEPIGNGRSAGEPAAKAAGHGTAAESNAGQRLADAGCLGSGQDKPRRRQGERAAIGRVGQGVWLLTAGVPCQPASRAGKQRGKDDERWLWPAAVSVFAAVRPAWGLFENPPGIGDVGLAGILSDLGREGYAVRVFSLGACALGAPHRRMRYWIVCKRIGMADSNEPVHQRPESRAARSNGAKNGLHPEHSQSQLAHTPQRGQREHRSASGDTGHADQCGQGGMGDAECFSNGGRGRSKGQAAGTCRRDDRSMPWSNSVWLPCADGKIRRAPDDSFSLVDGLHRSVLGALGNSIVSQVAQTIIAAMIQSEEQS